MLWSLDSGCPPHLLLGASGLGNLTRWSHKTKYTSRLLTTTSPPLKRKHGFLKKTGEHYIMLYQLLENMFPLLNRLTIIIIIMVIITISIIIIIAMINMNIIIGTLSAPWSSSPSSSASSSSSPWSSSSLPLSSLGPGRPSAGRA